MSKLLPSRRRLRNFGLVILVSLGFSPALGFGQTIISVNFQGGNPVGLSSSAVTGAISVANWNNVAAGAAGVAYQSYSGPPISLNTSTGSISAISLTSWVNGVDGLEGPYGSNSSPQEILFGGGLNNHFGPASFTITGLDAFVSYDILVYYTAFDFGTPRRGQFSAASSSDIYYAAGISSYSTSFTQSNSTTAGTYSNGNYVRFSGLTAASEIITYGQENNRVFMTGFQVIGVVPEPTPLIFLLTGGLACLIVRRGRAT